MKSGEPYWGLSDSTFNFCEADYVHSIYIAEVISLPNNHCYPEYFLVHRGGYPIFPNDPSWNRP